MGLLSNLFGLEKPLERPQIDSVLPPIAVQKIYAGQLPILKIDKLVLQKNEQCRYVDRGVKLTYKKIRVSTRTGANSRIMKGFSIFGSQGTSEPVDKPEFTKGLLYVTDNRIIFVASKNAFEYKITKLTSIVTYSDAVELQFGNKVERVFVPDSNLVKAVIGLIT